MSGAEHWFDRLATLHTRRQAFKAAIATSALSLPLLRVDPAVADTVHACQKGCLYTNHQNTDQALDVCAGSSFAIGEGYGFLGLAFGLGVLSFHQSVLKIVQSGNACSQQALLQQKANAFDCSQPNCPGFNPKATNGGCAGCKPTDACCSDQTVTSGYQCCECCGPNGGCASGVTACGS